MTREEVVAETIKRDFIAEAKQRLRDHLLKHSNPGVRAMAEFAEPDDDHPAVVRIAAALKARATTQGKDA